MTIYLILMFMFLAGQCLGYTLRRDIGNIRRYCNQMCTGCGGKPILEKDVCVCDFKENTDKTKACVNRHKSKFDFLGIKYEVRHKIKKRSIYNSRQPYLLDGEPPRHVQKEGYKYLMKRSYIIPEHFYLQGRMTETLDGFKYSKISPRMILTEQSKEDHDSSYLTPEKSQLIPFGVNNFLPITTYPKRDEGDHKMLLPRPNDNYPGIHYGILKNTSGFQGNNIQNAGGDDNDISCDYEEVSEEYDCGIDYESTENLGGKGFELVISDGFDFGDNTKEGYGWERVIPDADYQNFLSEIFIPRLQCVRIS